MKKALFVLLTLLLALLPLAACDEAGNDVSKGEKENSKTVSVPSEDSSEPEESQTEVASIWYGDEELYAWYLEFIEDYEENKGDGIHQYTKDNKHYGFFQTLEGGLINAVGGDLFYEYIDIFNKTNDINLAAFCEYYDITVDEYKQVYAGDFEEFGKTLPGEKPGGRVILYIQIHQYDIWFSEQYWNHPDLLIEGYVVPEIDDHYTSLEDRGGYTRRYYLIDRLLIEHVGVDEFEEWLDEKEDKDQNILDFIEYFGITRETYEELYADIYFKPYNAEYLFGTPEMQETYFKVHPVDELGAVVW